MNYIITFDLHDCSDEEKNQYYFEIEKELNKGKCIKPTNNTYLVSSDVDNCQNIRDLIKKICKNKCSVFVAGLDGRYASYTFIEISKKISAINAKCW